MGNTLLMDVHLPRKVSQVQVRAGPVNMTSPGPCHVCLTQCGMVMSYVQSCLCYIWMFLFLTRKHRVLLLSLAISAPQNFNNQITTHTFGVSFWIKESCTNRRHKQRFFNQIPISKSITSFRSHGFTITRAHMAVKTKRSNYMKDWQATLLISRGDLQTK